MPNPLVIAYHLIWTAYSWWLPNDPRGSGSHVVRTDVLAMLNELHFGRKKVQPAGRDVREFYEKAGDLLKHPLLVFDETCRRLIADAFAQVVDEQRYTCYACAIMPDHIHILVRKHKDQAEKMVERFKEASRVCMIDAGQRAITHPTWLAGHGCEGISGSSGRHSPHDSLRRTESDQGRAASPGLAVREGI